MEARPVLSPLGVGVRREIVHPIPPATVSGDGKRRLLARVRAFIRPPDWIT